MTFAEMTRDDRVAYFRFHGPYLEAGYAEFQAALRKWAETLHACAATERRVNSVASLHFDLTEATDKFLAEEVRAYLGVE